MLRIYVVLMLLAVARCAGDQVREPEESERRVEAADSTAVVGDTLMARDTLQ